MQTLNAHDVKQHVDSNDDTLVIDVLPTEHYEKEHIPGATNIPLSADRFTEAVEGIAQDKSRPIVVYCASEECDLSPKAAEHLEGAGFENVADFEGGIKEWKNAGYEVESA